MSTAIDNYYQILGVHEDATQTEITDAFWRLAEERHPDFSDNYRTRGGFVRCYEALRIIGRPTRRRIYDALLLGAEGASSPHLRNFTRWRDEARRDGERHATERFESLRGTVQMETLLSYLSYFAVGDEDLGLQRSVMLVVKMALLAILLAGIAFVIDHRAEVTNLLSLRSALTRLEAEIVLMTGHRVIGRAMIGSLIGILFLFGYVILLLLPSGRRASGPSLPVRLLGGIGRYFFMSDDVAFPLLPAFAMLGFFTWAFARIMGL